MWKQVMRNNKKKRKKKKVKKNEKERCKNENISFCYQRVVHKKKFSRNFINLIEAEKLSNTIER